MTPRAKNAIYSLILLVVLAGIYFYRKNAEKTPVKSTENLSISTKKLLLVQGKAQGTTFSIKYLDEKNRDLQVQIDSILLDFDKSLSTYRPDAEISNFNKPETDSIKFSFPYFYPVLKASKEIFEISKGAFDPTIAPLVNAYGFGFTKAQDLTENQLKDILQYVDFKNISFTKSSVKKLKKGMTLDFNAIAQGYSVDVVANYLKTLNINNFMVEIGGEVACSGKNQDGKTWGIGIKNPVLAEKGETATKAVVLLDNKALATSGNYEKFYIKNGKKFAHILNPTTGKPAEQNILSATVVADNAMIADGFATVFMVVGLEKSKEIVMNNPAQNLEVYFIYTNEKGELRSFMTEKMKKIIQEIQ